MLTVSDLRAGYHGGEVLRGVSLTVTGVHALLGHNGAGKTTFAHAVAGLLPLTSGSIDVDERPVERLAAHRRARLGLRLVPQGRRCFASLSVAEHLSLARRPGPWTAERVYEVFPGLAARRSHPGGKLSGGEQQMLALGRALVGQPRVLLLDEPAEGLVPALATAIADVVGVLRGEGVAVLVTAPAWDTVARVADEITVLTTGRVTAEFTGEEARAKPELVADALRL
ncbi:ABC transporter ATP-binding protein [Actinorhabdospora filicis]|uniref:ABC transporter ATP-binding protein n=1 Tax=Actinorhabdospora filicis TaxID=1785913 RepID=A0A9W6W9L6_9ACTN|nr:ATP-binding cassette domain-containing protein [Actinorhabdospora filicis]GLZ76760.1 ABC transporter ATP-binding protein [Actinorhabdospora filicis]